ncbi:TPA: tape measure protein [Enterobacter asburiae]|nr:tape measure protein [Enterobacter asburiae]HDR2806523.1 tape measure protein [Enterobacter asburiae]HDR2812005.1 tape measure protein [Enterobacter asburiae]HDR2817385.1 tape measure protein [Enterobacter asburiae]
MSTNVGEIYYEVGADVAGLLQGQRQADRALDSMEQSFDRTNRASQNLDTGLSKLASTIKGVIAAAALRQMADMVQKYQEMAERVQMATSSQAEFEMVQKRLLDTANGTYRSLQEAQELYIRTADSLRSMSYSTSEAVDVQDSMSYAFVKNATSADRAGAAIDAFSKSVNTGKVAADQWETLTTAIPSVINDIAAASGQSAAAIRALGAAGQLTARQLTEGLRQSLDENTAAAAGMSNNLVDASVRIKTAITSILVAFENQTGALQEFTNGLIKSADWMLSFGENAEQMKGVIDATTSAALIFAGVMGSRYVGALAMATTAKIQSIAASRQQAAADVQAAQSIQFAANALQRKALADKEAAISAMNLAQAEYNVARGSAAETIALNNLIAAKSAARTASLSLAQAEIAQAAAQNTAAAAARNASVAMGMARGALALIGGPAGAAMLAGAAIFYFYQKAQQARQESIEFADSLDGVLAKMKDMNSAQLAANIAKAEQSIIDQREAIADLTQEYDELSQRKTFIEQAAQIRGAAAVAEDYAEINRDLAIQAGKVDSAENKLSQTVSSVGILRAQLNGTLLQGIDLLRRDGEAAGVTAGIMNNLGNMFKYASDEKNNFNSSSIKVERPKGVQDYLDNLSTQVELQGELNERKRAQLKAEQEIRKLGGNENDVRLARERAAAEYDSVEAQKQQKKAADQAASSGKQAATQAESVTQKLESLKQQADMSAQSTAELSREQAILTAQQSLGKAATQEQIALAGQYAAKKWDTANAIKAEAAANKLLPESAENQGYQQDIKDLKTAFDAKKITQEQYNNTSERLEQEHQSKLAKIRADQSVSPLQEAAGTVDPVQQLANQHTQQLALIQQLEQQGVIAHSNALMLKNAADTEYEQKRTAAQWEIWRNQSAGNEALAASFDALAGNASNALTGIITGSMSAEDAMRSIGNTVLNSLINTFVQMGVEWVKSAIMGQAAQTAAIGTVTAVQTAAVATQTATSTAAAATTAAAWTPAAILSSIASMGTAAAIGLGAVAGVIGANLLGKRKNGGPVSAGGMYQVGESGMPEIYQASTGKQYMIPGDNGKVISNKDMQGAGGSGVVINIQNYTSSSVDAQTSTDGNGGLTVDVVVADLNNGGPISNAITSNMNVKRTPRGQN